MIGHAGDHSGQREQYNRDMQTRKPASLPGGVKGPGGAEEAREAIRKPSGHNVF